MSANTKTVWIAWVNSDLSEGRGFHIPLAICESKTTAKRVGAGRSAQGCNADIRPFELVYQNGNWLGPVCVEMASREDIAADEKQARREAAIAKARAAGLTEQDVADLYTEMR